MTSPTMPPTPMTPHNYPIGHHRHSSMTRIGRKWLINMFFQHQPPQPPIPHTNTPQRPTNVFQISYVINHGSPHPHDPTQLPYRSPQLLIRDQKWPKIVQKHGFFYLCLHKVTFHTWMSLWSNKWCTVLLQHHPKWSPPARPHTYTLLATTATHLWPKVRKTVENQTCMAWAHMGYSRG